MENLPILTYREGSATAGDPNSARQLGARGNCIWSKRAVGRPDQAVARTRFGNWPLPRPLLTPLIPLWLTGSFDILKAFALCTASYLLYIPIVGNLSFGPPALADNEVVC